MGGLTFDRMRLQVAGLPPALRGNSVQCRNCPRNCKRRAVIRQSHWGHAREDRMKVKTRESGDLPETDDYPQAGCPGGLIVDTGGSSPLPVPHSCAVTPPVNRIGSQGDE